MVSSVAFEPLYYRYKFDIQRLFYQIQTFIKHKMQTVVKILVNTSVFEVSKQALAFQNPQLLDKLNQQKLILPGWVDTETFSYIAKYLKNKILQQYNQKKMDNNFLVQIIKISDFLSLTKFQEKFISQILTPNIKISNCVMLLQQTHRKLKTQQAGSQSWYGLLNACISYLAINLNQIYTMSSEKIKKLHEKILNQILDRAIRNGNLNKKMIFQLIMESKKVNNVELLCQSLRNSILNKRINPKIHAKLSWKLQDLLNIKDKKTKNFKFLDYDWQLQASRTSNKQLIVKLVYEGHANRKQLGAFYAKVIWWTDSHAEEKIQQKIKLNYILMSKKHDIEILKLSEEKQRQLGPNKIELSIFCCMDQIYTFILNYIASFPQEIKNKCDSKLTHEEIFAIVKYLRQRQNHSDTIEFIKILQYSKVEIPEELTSNYQYNKLSEKQILEKYKTKESPSSYYSSVMKSDTPALSQNGDSRSSMNQSRKSQERQQSRGRLRKIFASSPSNKQPSSNSFVRIQLQDINRISNIKNYFYDKGHPFYNQL